MHCCPSCGQACYCGGDIEDHENEEAEDECTHECDEDDQEGDEE